MQGFDFLFRTALSGVLFYFLVIQWALVPFLNQEMSMELAISSVFFSTAEPIGLPRTLLCMARACTGLIVVIYTFIPGLSLFLEFQVSRLSNTIALVLAAFATAFYIGSVVAFYLFYV